MNHTAYHSLIEDTLTYVKALLPIEAALPPKSKPKPPAAKKRVAPIVSPKPVVSAPVQVKKKTEDPFIQLKSVVVPAKDPTHSLRKLLMELEPELFLHESPPSDAKAKRINEAWRERRDAPTIPILFQERAYHPFMMNIARAIDISFSTCRLVEVEAKKKWDLFFQSSNMKFIIAPDQLIFSSKELLPFYKENPQEKTRFLGNIPLLLLPDLSLYYKDPYLKRSLWNVITQNLQPLF